MSVVIGDAVGFGAGSLGPSEPLRSGEPSQPNESPSPEPRRLRGATGAIISTSPSMLGERGGRERHTEAEAYYAKLYSASLAHRIVTKPCHKTVLDLRRKQKRRAANSVFLTMRGSTKDSPPLTL